MPWSDRGWEGEGANRGARSGGLVLGAEYLIHDLGASRDHGLELVTVYGLGRVGAPVPGEIGDLLDRDAVVATGRERFTNRAECL